MDRPHFIPLPVTDKIATIEKADVQRATMFLPTHSAYFASYFTITGLHGLHVLGGVHRVYLHVAAGQQKTLPAQP